MTQKKTMHTWLQDKQSGHPAIVDNQKSSLTAQESLETHHHELSYADQQKQKAHPIRAVFMIILSLLAAVCPYWVGQRIAYDRTNFIIVTLRLFPPFIWSIIGWLVLVLLFIFLGSALLTRRRRFYFGLALVCFALEQGFSGAALLSSNFWSETYILYGNSSPYANALDLGIVAAASAIFIFSIVFVSLLVFARKGSRITVLLRGWSAFYFFLICEFIGLCVALCIGIF